MAFKKSSSPVVESSRIRSSALSSIDPKLDLGNGLTLAKYQAAIQDIQGRLDTYNAALSQADDAANNLRAGEKELRELSERMLAGVGVTYGKDSSQYEKAGGTRKSEIKRPAKAKAAAAAANSAGGSK
ncbi:MAG: hypothetical protein WA821_01735 [Anaerolineales bacterium]